ncbi:hypothetical protein GCM10010187_05040 [Actinomadura coerulea]|nr:septum formation family protein [Actinomadura coerulea]GGP92589.1 hypothetical protein GCM10010187_05040 [Actinomadura coerulea]
MDPAWAPPDTPTSDADSTPGPADAPSPADGADETSPADGPDPSPIAGERPDRARTNGFAIAALVTGAVGLVLFAIAFAVAALVQIRRRGGGGRGLALGGLGASAAWLAAAAIIAALFGRSLFSAAEGEADPRQRDGYVLSSTLRVGDCFTAQTHDSADPYVYPLPCASPHNGEVVAEAPLPAGPFPGVGRLTARAAALCEERTPDNVKKVVDDDFDARAELPKRKDWESGKRTVTCTLVYVGEDKALTAPLSRSVITPRHEAMFEQGVCLEKWDDNMTPPVVDCDLPHQFQLLATYKLQDKEYPGRRKLEKMVLEGCAKRAADIWGADPPLDRVYPTFSTPTKQQWRRGYRDVYCLITGKKGPLNRSFVPKK